MSKWISTSAQSPLRPGNYWVRTDTRRWNEGTIVHIAYISGWAHWDGEKWSGDAPDYWYGEGKCDLIASPNQF